MDYLKKYIKYKKKYICLKNNIEIKGGTIKHSVIDKYYLCTQSRYDKTLTKLMPFGSFKELEEIYNRDEDDLKFIKSQKIDIPDAKIVGDSQYGIYFRLVEKSEIDKYKLYANDSTKFKSNRSFIFNFGIFLEYVTRLTNNIPLFWYSSSNYYGYEKYSSELLFKNILDFLNNIENLIQGDYQHELVCRIPIPLDQTTGFIGKINAGTLYIKNTKERLENEERLRREYEESYRKEFEERLRREYEESYRKEFEESYRGEYKQEFGQEQLITDEKTRCSAFNNNNEACKQEKCWYDQLNQQCKPTYSFVVKS